MTELAQSPLVQALAWALTHFLWQGTAIALLALALIRLAAGRASVRYAIGVAALAAMVAAPCLTLIKLTVVQAPSAVTVTAATETPALPPVSDPLPVTGTARPELATVLSPVTLAAVVAAWLAGVVVFSVRLLGGWIVARRMTCTAVRPAAAQIQELATSVANRLALRQAVAVLESSAVAVPVVVGWLTPAIVLPVAALAGLSPAQIEALLAHELAHVRRHDYLVNVLQSIAEVVLFYHPAVWLLSRRVRVERELCCDDLALGVCDRVVYATALTDLAAMTSPRLALAATDGDLLSRIRRILTPKETDMSITSSWSPAVGVVLIVGVLVPVSLFSARQAQERPTQAAQPAPSAATVSPAASASAGQASGGATATLSARGGVTATMGRTGGEASALTVTAQQITLEMGGVVSRADQEPAPQSAQSLEQARREAEARAARQEADIQAARRELERVRKLFEVGLVSASQVLEAETHLAVLDARGNTDAVRAAEVAAVARQLADARARAEVGTISQDHVAEVEARLAMLNAQGDAAKVLKVELDQARQQLERSKQLYERGLVTSDALREAEARLQIVERRTAGAARAEANRVESERERATQAWTEQRRVREVAPEQRGLREVAPEAAPDVDPSRPIAAGDVLSVIITGEPDLPTTYRVQADGTIRLPLLGSFKVAGQTGAQVQAAIGKQLADRRLGSASQVHVARRTTTRVR